jgi:hypothetical protein
LYIVFGQFSDVKNQFTVAGTRSYVNDDDTDGEDDEENADDSDDDIMNAEDCDDDDDAYDNDVGGDDDDDDDDDEGDDEDGTGSMPEVLRTHRTIFDAQHLATHRGVVIPA